MRAKIPGVAPFPPTVEFLFEGAPIACCEGDTVAAALVDAGEPACRETVAGDARGVFCGMGVCHECLVTIDGTPGRRACMTPVRDGMRVERQPALPVLQGAPDGPPVAERELAMDVLVVGGGPAGMAAAVCAAQSGLDVVLVDERYKLGGQYYKQPSAPAQRITERRLDRQFRDGRRLIGRVGATGVTVLDGVKVWGAFGPHELAAIGAGVRWTLRPRRLVLASGAYERGVPFPGWTLPGVMTTGAAQTLLRSHQVAPGARVLVSGNGPLNMQVAAELVRAGAQVVGLAEVAKLTEPSRAGALARMLAAAPGLIRDGLRYQTALLRARVPILNGSAVVRCEGAARVERAVVAAIDDDGRAVPGTERTFAVDAVCVGFGFLPSNELTRALGCRHELDANGHALVVAHDERGRTSVPDVWAVGDAARVGGAQLARAAGLVAGADVVRSLGRGLPAALGSEVDAAERRRRAGRRFQAALWTLYSAPYLCDQLADADTLICRCEGVPRAAVEAALGDGLGHIGALKRATRAGMGGCQGRYCAGLLVEMMARASGRPLDERSWFAPSAPVKPAPIADLAGRPS